VVVALVTVIILITTAVGIIVVGGDVVTAAAVSAQRIESLPRRGVRVFGLAAKTLMGTRTVVTR
jgi:hypothetical protein